MVTKFLLILAMASALLLASTAFGFQSEEPVNIRVQATSMMYERDFSSVSRDEVRRCHVRKTCRSYILVDRDGTLLRVSPVSRKACPKLTDQMTAAIRIGTSNGT